MSQRDPSGLSPSVVAAYGRRVEQGELARDPRQLAVAAALDRLAGRLADQQASSKSGALGWLLGRGRRPEPPRGLYIHGGVGRGKTLLMDLFFAIVPIRSKRRVHFNAFMAEAHDRIARHRKGLKEGTAEGDDPIPPVAAAIAADAQLVCFDEFAVTDIADAMILSRLFGALFDRGVTLVATSNVAPDDLYRDGLNRGLFLPFIDLLQRHADIVALDGAIDYRLRGLARLPVYLCPDDTSAGDAFEEAWAVATAGLKEEPESVSVLGRSIAVPRAAGRTARFHFDDLCRQPLAARDFLALADRFDTFFIAHIPVLAAAERNAAKRLILLVDTLYDRRKRLIATAAARPDALYQGSRVEGFEFARTASRLVEMQSAAWPS